jgi:hypothetical protein
VGFVVDKVALGQFFLRVVGFPLSISSTGAPLIVKLGKKKLLIFILGLHKKP